MKNKVLIEELKKLPENMEVVIEKINDEFKIGEIETIEVREIGFSESNDSKPLCKEKCIVLSDIF